MIFFSKYSTILTFSLRLCFDQGMHWQNIWNLFCFCEMDVFFCQKLSESWNQAKRYWQRNITVWLSKTNKNCQTVCMADPIYVKICINIICVGIRIEEIWKTMYHIINSCYVWGWNCQSFLLPKTSVWFAFYTVSICYFSNPKEKGMQK